MFRQRETTKCDNRKTVLHSNVNNKNTLQYTPGKVDASVLF